MGPDKQASRQADERARGAKGREQDNVKEWPRQWMTKCGVTDTTVTILAEATQARGRHQDTWQRTADSGFEKEDKSSLRISLNSGVGLFLDLL